MFAPPPSVPTPATRKSEPTASGSAPPPSTSGGPSVSVPLAWTCMTPKAKSPTPNNADKA